jgi:hypothetical protein
MFFPVAPFIGHTFSGVPRATKNRLYFSWRKRWLFICGSYNILFFRPRSIQANTITKICNGCGNCSDSIEPDATKTERTAEAGKIIGFGPIIITASVEASNAERVNKTFNGFVLGLLVIIT